MKNQDVYANAVRALIDVMTDVEQASDKGIAMYELLSLASNIDSLRAELVRQATGSAEDLLRIAQEAASGAARSSNPLNNSRLADLPMTIAALEAKREAFVTLARIVLGVKETRALRGDIEEAFLSK